MPGIFTPGIFKDGFPFRDDYNETGRTQPTFWKVAIPAYIARGG